MKKRIIFGAIAYSLLCAQVLAAVTYDLTPTDYWVREKGGGNVNGYLFIVHAQQMVIIPMVFLFTCVLVV